MTDTVTDVAGAVTEAGTGCGRGWKRDGDRNMPKSGTTTDVGTTAPGVQAHPPTVDGAVGGDSSNTANTARPSQAQAFVAMPTG